MKWTKDKLQQHLIMTALENKELQNTLQHRDSVLSIMYDLVRSEVPDWYKIEIIKAVINVECWSDDTEKDKKLVEKFWNREF